VADFATGSPAWLEAEQAKLGKSWGAGKSCLSRFGLGFVLALLLSGCSAVPAAVQEPSDSNNEHGAVAQCEPRIGVYLKNPSTAEFNSKASSSGSRVWKVTGTVDAETGFGATIRSSFGCTVTIHEGNATTSVDYFSG